jgi:pseudoazurin
MIRDLSLVMALVIAPQFAVAETYEVQMLNKGDAGRMVFEPAALTIASGDTVKFVATDRGHNAETIKGMIPEGAEPFKGKMNKEIEVTLTEPGFYGVMCKPHFAMGMVMLIAVETETEVPEDFFAGRIPPKAKNRFDAQLSEF